MGRDWFTIRWSEAGVVLLDQRLLPGEEVYLTLTEVEGVAEAIETLAVRGAPAIGCAAAMGVALGAMRYEGDDLPGLVAHLEGIVMPRLARTRPTAINLFWALDRMGTRLDALTLAEGADVASVSRGLVAEAVATLEADIEICRTIGRHGAQLIPDGGRVLTHCNAGGLATGGYGTALGIVRGAVALGREVSVVADETRPLLQGARLTAWELARDEIPVTVCTDSMAGALMAKGEIDVVVVGADRIAANGDVANKIGTYSVAVLADAHGIPFYVAAPLSTIDRQVPDGAAIPIEERGREEVAVIGGRVMLPDGVGVRQPAFDVTPARLVAGIVTEKGVLRAPYGPAIGALF